MPLTVVLGGGSGFLGTHLKAALTARGHEVISLVRRPPRSASESRWDPYADQVDAGLIGSADVVINLAGSPTLGNPHSKKWARELRESRVTTTRVLAEAIAAADTKPRFLAGNGISYYGDHGDDVLTESADSRGDALLTSVTKEWQSATDAAADAGAPVLILRTAPVMDADAAPLKQLRLLFRAGLGGRIGDGSQRMPMISRRDWVGGVAHLAETEAPSGPYNLCCRETPTNAEFTAALGEATRGWAVLPVPKPIIKAAAGAMGPELLGSMNVRPAALEAAGYEFHDRTVTDVLAAALA